MTDPSFSIVIPTYQRRELVCETVRALRELTYEGWFEVIVVVDGSTDGSAAALRQLECPFPLSIIEQDNGGAAHARNRGAAEATGDIILFLDDDMLCSSDLLDQHARLYREGADAVTGEITPHHELPERLAPSDLPGLAHGARDMPATAFETFTGQLSVRRAVFESLTGFDEAYTADGGYGNEDLDFGARLLANHSLVVNPAAITVHRDELSRRQVLHRARLLAMADLRFARNHPHLAGELFERRGSSARTTRFLYRPISRVPLLSPLVASIAVAIAQTALRTRARSNPIVTRLFSIAYGASYWSTVNTGLMLPRSSN